MRRRAAVALLAALHGAPALAQWSEEALQRAFVAGMQQLEAGNAAEAEQTFRDLAGRVPSARVKLELARALYAQGKLDEAKALFKEVSVHSDTPWRVRDNIGHYVAAIEERTGYLKWGATVVSDTNPKSIAAQKEFAIGDIVVTPDEAPEKMVGARYTVQGWKPLSATTGVYGAASYTDFPNRNADRFIVDGGAVRSLVDSGRVRGKAGLELGTFADKLLYTYPYLGVDAVLHEDALNRLAGEAKAGPVRFPDFHYLDAVNVTAALTASRTLSPTAAASARIALEHSDAAERPYSYGGVDGGLGLNVLLPQSAFYLGANASVGARDYAVADPVFGQVRKDRKARAELKLGNKNWRWGDKAVALVASLEKNDSSIGFYSYRKTSVSILVE